MCGAARSSDSPVYAIALLTPDDEVCKDADNYSQPRPNVFFELGWFTAMLGRDKISIVFEKSVKHVSSDLTAIGGIEFAGNLNEKHYRAIHRDLQVAGVLPARGRRQPNPTTHVKKRVAHKKKR